MGVAVADPGGDPPGATLLGPLLGWAGGRRGNSGNLRTGIRVDGTGAQVGVDAGAQARAVPCGLVDLCRDGFRGWRSPVIAYCRGTAGWRGRPIARRLRWRVALRQLSGKLGEPMAGGDKFLTSREPGAVGAFDLGHL